MNLAPSILRLTISSLFLAISLTVHIGVEIDALYVYKTGKPIQFVSSCTDEKGNRAFLDLGLWTKEKLLSDFIARSKYN